MLAFACPHCGVRLQVQEAWAGRPLRCGSCKGVVATRAAAPVAASRAADPPTLPPAGPGPALDGELAGMLAPPQGPDELGRLGTYRVLGVLGQGGMGVVFRAEDTQLHRLVALKVMRPALAASPTNRQRFLREAQAAAALEHDHIITIYQWGEDRGIPFLAMQLLQGESLEGRLNRLGRLTAGEAARIGWAVAEGLAAAHAGGLVHRDIKPSNIWIEAPSGRVRVLDFGLARAVREELSLTQAGVLVGSPGYVAPEQVRGEPPDPRSDLFSLGCVLYRALSGRLPFSGPDTLAILSALAVQTPPSVRQLNPAVPPPLAGLVMRLLEKDPARRPSSARVVADALAALGREPSLPLAAEPARPIEPIAPTDTLVESADVPAAAEPELLGLPRTDETVQVELPEKAPFRARWWLLAGGLLTPLGLILVLVGVTGKKPKPAGAREASQQRADPVRVPAKVVPRQEQGLTPELCQLLQTAVKGKRLMETGNRAFLHGRRRRRDTCAEGGVLIGMQVGLKRFLNTQVVGSLRPVYLTKDGEKKGKWIGLPLAQTVAIKTIKAKPGYVVSGLAVRTGMYIDGFALKFVKLDKDQLRVKDHYQSEWVGNSTGGGPWEVPVQERFIVGIVGYLHADGTPGSLGLTAVLPPKD